MGGKNPPSCTSPPLIVPLPRTDRARTRIAIPPRIRRIHIRTTLPRTILRIASPPILRSKQRRVRPHLGHQFPTELVSRMRRWRVGTRGRGGSPFALGRLELELTARVEEEEASQEPFVCAVDVLSERGPLGGSHRPLLGSRRPRMAASRSGWTRGPVGGAAGANLDNGGAAA